MNTLAWARSSSSTSWSFSGLALNACCLISFKRSTQACLRGVCCLLCPQEVTVSEVCQDVAEDSGSDVEPLHISEIVFQEKALRFSSTFPCLYPLSGRIPLLSLRLGEPIETFVLLKVVEVENAHNEVLEKYVWTPLQDQWARQTALVLVTSGFRSTSVLMKQRNRQHFHLTKSSCMGRVNKSSVCFWKKGFGSFRCVRMLGMYLFIGAVQWTQRSHMIMLLRTFLPMPTF